LEQLGQDRVFLGKLPGGSGRETEEPSGRGVERLAGAYLTDPDALPRSDPRHQPADPAGLSRDLPRNLPWNLRLLPPGVRRKAHDGQHERQASPDGRAEAEIAQPTPLGLAEERHVPAMICHGPWARPPGLTPEVLETVARQRGFVGLRVLPDDPLVGIL